MKQTTISVCLFLAAVVNLHADDIMFSGSTWKLQAKEAELRTYKGQQSLFLNDGAANYLAADFSNGIIEFDVALSEGRGFIGVHWRVQDELNYEEFYMRSHQSGNPDACQYSPVYNGLSGWQLYHGDGYSIPVVYDFDAWMHVKLVINGKHAEVYIKDMTKPVLVIHEQKRPIQSGGFGLSTFRTAAHFANFSYKKDDNVTLKGEIKQLQTAGPGQIMNWQVSDAFPANRLEGKFHLTESDTKNLKWHLLKSEKSGTANLAEVQTRSPALNTVFTKAVIKSNADLVKQISFGYSDVIFVYLNGKLMYSGQNIYRSRDYRYLGTIGYFDNLYLPLKSGDNELVMAVLENFGGWGLQVKFTDPSGITLK